MGEGFGLRIQGFAFTPLGVAAVHVPGLLERAKHTITYCYPFKLPAPETSEKPQREIMPKSLRAHKGTYGAYTVYILQAPTVKAYVLSPWFGSQTSACAEHSVVSPLAMQNKTLPAEDT